MSATIPGDRSGLFVGLRHNAALRERLARLGSEVATGRVADPVRHRRAEMGGLADLDRRLALAGSLASAARDTADRLGAMGFALERVEGARATLFDRLAAGMPPGLSPQAAEAFGREAFEAVVHALGARWGEASLFAGTATGSPALAGAEEMLAALRDAAAGETTAAGLLARVTAWFEDPAGGFAAGAYRGNREDPVRPLGEGETVTLSARADDPALRAVLRAAALASLAASPLLAEGERRILVAQAREAALAAADGLVALRGRLGAAEARAEAAEARHTARAGALAILRQQATAADPYAAASALEAVRLQLETHHLLTGRLAALSLVRHLR
ncbi:hypothetical protein [Rubellimicrobium sp. CFH 75288]|uniref:hypothetical protein n=1 Tax=Rubellimicrobium sp. CFH 75288 TaxID=2697034 RepID=UPI001411D809|nr:hypothetical protein [Rubellimicrobium sp. CFH 75288]NAZ37272.1 hypothetical protein [Rubellimicrobium sp. CFH 75288]